MSMIAKIVNLPRRFADWYNVVLKSKPWTVSTISVALITGGGDYFAQVCLED